MTTATLDGLPLTNESPVGWTFLPGTDPHGQTVIMEKGAAFAAQAASSVSGSRLVGNVPGFGGLDVKALTILGVFPTADPSVRLVTVADLRHLWPGVRVYGRYNMPRRTGARRRVGNANAPIAVQPIAADLAYHPWSLNNGKPWDAVQVLERVLKRVLRGKPYRIGKLPANALPVQALVLDDTGDGAIRRVLGLFGDAVGIYVDADGTTVVYDTTDEGEKGLVGPSAGGRTQVRGQNAGPPLVVGPQLWEARDRSRDRPAKIRVLFSRLAEFRFDGADQASTASVARNGDVALRIENVLPVPDLELQIPATAGRKARTVLQGTWITIEEALDAWNAQTWPGVAPTLPYAFLRRIFVGGGLNSFCYPKFDLTGVYQRRINAIKQHYRQTWRIVRPWRDRLGELFPARSALSDDETGANAPAPVFCNYAVFTGRGGEKGITSNPENVQQAVNVYAAGSATASVHAAAVTTLRQAPAQVQILDQDEAILRFGFVLDGSTETNIYFSAFDPATIPSFDPTRGHILPWFIRLEETHEVSTVLSALVVSPNDQRALHSVEVTPKEAEAALGKLTLGECKGPEVELRVVPHGRRGFARFAWEDTRATQVRLSHAAAGDDPAEGNAYGEPLNPDELRALALGVATRYYAERRDGLTGSLATGWTPDMRPVGASGAVSHQIQSDGAAITSVSFPADLRPAPDPFAGLPESVRKSALGEVTP